jgi:hypothetical protein
LHPINLGGRCLEKSDAFKAVDHTGEPTTWIARVDGERKADISLADIDAISHKNLLVGFDIKKPISRY